MSQARNRAVRLGWYSSGVPSVLIVEDEPDLASLIDFNLRQEGLETRQALTGEQALKLARERVPDLVLLDVMLPDLNGTEVCRMLKADARTRRVPVILVTARNDESDRISGLELGADDYVAKPFNVRELVLRVQAVLRRAGAPTEQERRSVGPLTIDVAEHRCFVEGVEVPLTLLEFRLLHHLMTRLGRVQTRDQLLREVWEFNVATETRTIDTHVMRLREKLGSARACIETVRGVGYRMVVPSAAPGRGGRESSRNS